MLGVSVFNNCGLQVRVGVLAVIPAQVATRGCGNQPVKMPKWHKMMRIGPYEF